ncbi:helix-turn-helix domain-containing protein [Paenibacillus sp.]|uniref:response regulator transcription factor n=1 Tax=Paenibacillus sp. TaxID=58172 RepID=UPI0028121671|nr:helix-turn-helix domain-containing protein [Paenibacillus sp.]
MHATIYKLLIVDDEQLIVDWLYRLFGGLPRLNLDIYRAYSGEQAMQWLNRTKIDIVLSDIHMPGMDGMQLLENIKSRWPDCKVVFLTGYNQFEYVYTAIKHDGVSYLLKTETDDEIVGAVEKAIADVERSFRDAERLDKARQQVNKAIPLLQKQYLSNLLSGDQALLPVAQAQLDEAELPLRADLPVYALLGRMDNSSRQSDRPKKDRLIYTARSLIEDVAFKRMHTAFVHEEPYFIWLFQPAEAVADWGQACLYVREMLDTAQRACAESLHVGMSFALAKGKCEWDMVAAKTEGLKRLLNFRIGPSGGVIATEGDPGSEEFDGGASGPPRPDSTLLIQLNRIGKLASALERGDRHDFFDTFSEVADYLKRVRNMRYAPASEVYLSLSLKLISYINRWGLAETQSWTGGLERLTRLEFESWADAVDELRTVAEHIFAVQARHLENRERDTVLRVQKYISEHLSEDISLVKLGELTHFNPSYLSRLFKQVTGINISDLIQQARIDKAKELLGRTGMKIQDVSAAVGFDSPAYFAKFFKKSTQMTPQEYRDSFT